MRLKVMRSIQELPNPERLSTLAATILLFYALGRLINFPTRELAIQLPGIYLNVELSIHTFVALVNAALTAAGADWLMRDHPYAKLHGTAEHWLLPALTAWVIGIPLFQLPLGLAWWAGFAFGGTLLMLVLVAEYIAIDPQDTRQPLASAVLTALSFALFLTLAISLRFSGIRLFQLLPSLFLASGLVSLRTLHLRLGGRWLIIHATMVAFLCTQLAAVLHYLPIDPIPYGLLLLGPIYTLTSLFANLAADQNIRQAAIEPIIVFIILMVTAIWAG